ncbi:MAG: large conductance mechanosensitive channel protein MscL [Clostridia bacterium]
MSKFTVDFKKFIKESNIFSLAIAVTVGTAFGKIATSLVDDLIMPLLSYLFGKDQFSTLKIVLKAETETSPAITFNYGIFLQNVFQFFIIAFFIFLFFKFIKKSQEKIDLLNKYGGIKSLIFRKKIDKISKDVSEIKNEHSENKEQLSSKTEALLTEIRDLLKENEKTLKIKKTKIKKTDV